jgi:excisionase family DNA binding protein
MSTIAVPPFETLISHDIAAGQIEFESIVFLRDDYLGPIPINKRPVTLLAEAWSRLMERVAQGGTSAPKKQEPTGKAKPEAWVGPDEMARQLGVTKPKLLKLTRQGRIPSMKLGPKTIRFNPEKVKTAVDRTHKQKPNRADSRRVQKHQNTPQSSLPNASWDKTRVHTKMKQQPKD